MRVCVCRQVTVLLCTMFQIRILALADNYLLYLISRELALGPGDSGTLN